MKSSSNWSAGRIALWLGAVVMLFPTLWMVMSAFKTPQELLHYPPQLLPETFSLDSIRYAWFERNFSRMMVNSTIVSTVVTLFTVLSSAYIAYVFVMFRFPFQRVLFFIIISTMMVPLPVLLIPHFQIVLTVGWINTFMALIAPYAFSAFGIYLMIQFLDSFPVDLIEAARVEGVSERQIFQYVVLPLLKAPCVALGIITFLHQWESLLWPIVAANDPSMQTLSVGLATFSGTAVEDASLYNPYSAALIAAAPLLVLFVIFQRMIVKGIAFTGMK